MNGTANAIANGQACAIRLTSVYAKGREEKGPDLTSPHRTSPHRTTPESFPWVQQVQTETFRNARASASGLVL